MTDTLYDGRHFRTVKVIDEGNREALAIEVSPSLPSVRVIAPRDALIPPQGERGPFAVIRLGVCR